MRVDSRSEVHLHSAHSSAAESAATRSAESAATWSPAWAAATPSTSSWSASDRPICIFASQLPIKELFYVEQSAVRALAEIFLVIDCDRT